MSSDPRLGTLIAHYRIERVLGRGGMGVVYLAMDPRLERRVALKVLAPELLADASFQERFAREAKMAAATEHPNIIPIYDAGEADGLLYLAMRFVDGTDLGSLIDAGGRQTPERSLAILRQVASALDAAHARGIVHRDVKPPNILISSGVGPDATDHVYLTDFGLTKRTTGRTRLTAVGQFVGTIDYVAPEQVQGHDVDGRTDEYSLACVAYECLTGEVPYRRESEIAVVMAHLTDSPPAASKDHAELTSRVDTVLARGMAKAAEERYPSCIEFVIALRHAITDRSPEGAATPQADRAPGADRGFSVLPPMPQPPPTSEPPPAQPEPERTVVSRQPPAAWSPPAAPPQGGAVTPPGGVMGEVAAPPWQRPKRPDERRDRRDGGGGGKRIAVIAAVIVLLAAVGVGAFLLLGGEDAPEPTGEVTTPPVIAADCGSVPLVEGDDLSVEEEQLFVMRSDGTDPTRLSDGEAIDSGGSWRPDCSQLVFARGERGSGGELLDDDVFVISSDGSLITPLFDDEGDDAGQFWSPRDDFIVFTSDSEVDGLAQSDVFIMRTDGSGVTRLTEDEAKDAQPQISPDGQRIAWASYRHGEDNSEIYVMNIDGTNQTRLTTDAAEDPANDFFPTWSPDGTQIAWTSNREGDTEIFVMSASDGSGDRPLTDNDDQDKQPSWSIDDTIAWWSDRDDDPNIYVMDAVEGDLDTQAPRITTDREQDKDPSWSPDGTLIVFTREPASAPQG